MAQQEWAGLGDERGRSPRWYTRRALRSLRAMTEQSWPEGRRVDVAACGLRPADGLHGPSGTEGSQKELKCGPRGGTRVTLEQIGFQLGES